MLPRTTSVLDGEKHRFHASRFSYLLKTVSQCCRSRVLLTIFKRCLFQKKSTAAASAPRFHPPVLADARRNSDRAGRPPRNHGDGDGSPRGERCYQNTAGNQPMLPYKVKCKSPVLWEKIQTDVLKPFFEDTLLKI